MGPLVEDGHHDDGRAIGHGNAAQGEESRRLANQMHHMNMQNSRANGNANGNSPTSSAPNTSGGELSGGERDAEGHRINGERNRSRNRSGRTASGTLRVCKKCGLPLNGQFVRALDGTFHLDCFRCAVRKFP